MCTSDCTHPLSRTSYEMASEKPKRVDRLPKPSSKPQRNEELGAVDLNNSPAGHNGILDDPLPPFPFFQTEDMQGMPQHYAQEMPLPAMRMMNDFSQFNFSDHTAFDHDYLCGPFPDIPLAEGNVNESVDCFPLCSLTDVSSKMYDDLQNSKIDGKVESARSDVARGSEMCREAAGANISDVRRSSLTRERGASTPMAMRNSTVGRRVINNIVNTSASHSTHPQIVDESSLKLGVGSNAEPRSTYNVSSRYSTLKYNEAALPQSSALCGQKDDTSSLSSSSKMTGDFSTIRNNTGGFDNKASNDSGFSSLTQNVDGLSRVVRNASRASQQVQNVEFSNFLPNIGGFSNQMQIVGGISPQTQNVDGFYSQLQNVEQLPRLTRNECSRASSLLANRQHYHSISSNWNSGPRVNANARFANVNPSAGFLGFPTEPLILHNRNQVGIPDYGHGATGLQSYSFIRNATQSSFDQRQYPHTGTFTNLSPDRSLVVPLVGVTRSNSGQSHSGQVIPAANAPAQASSIPCRPSRKRGASESSLATPEALHRKFRVTRASSHLSTPNMAQIASPHAPPPLAWTPSFLRPPSVQLARPCIIQSPPDAAQINAPYPALVRIPHLSPPPVQAAHRNLAQCASNVAQMTPPHSPLAWTPPNPALVQTAHSHLVQFAQNLTRPPPNAPLAGTPLSRPLLIRTVRQNMAQNPPIRPLLALNTSVRPPLSHRVPPLPSTKAPYHIKWLDPEKTPQLSGHQCFICKRDLSFTPEGPVEQPVNPPPVAVLPCRHHFHAFCLERITESDAENPPCIPCALGDKN